MSEHVRVRLLLVCAPGDTEPVVVGCVDEAIWDHWTDADDERWRAEGRRTWGMNDPGCEWREVWAEFAPADLAAAFDMPVARATSVALTDDVSPGGVVGE